jgi:hypothetical protein
MMVVVVAIVTKSIVSNMGIPFDLLDTGGEKILPSRQTLEGNSSSKTDVGAAPYNPPK